MPIVSFEKVLKIISTILSILSAALSAFTSQNVEPSNDDEK